MTKTKIQRGAVLGLGLSPKPAGSGPPRQSKSELIAAMLAQGLKSHQAGRLFEAESLYNQVLAQRPDHFDCLHLLGVIFHQRGNHAEAVRRIDQALTRNPDHAAALNNRGIALSAQNRLVEAFESFSRAVTVQRDFAEAHSNRGNVLRQLGRFQEALASCDRALQLRPDYVEAHSNRGLVLHYLLRFDEALASCDRAIALAPHCADAHCNRGLALKELKRFEEALASYDRAIALRGDLAQAHSNRGNILRELKRFEEALASYDRATELDPNFTEAFYNRGIALEEMDRVEEALGSYSRSAQIEPDHADAHLNEALCRLVLGDFERGWEKFEWRWATTHLRDHKRTFAQPLWLGADQIAGKTILLHAEQGLGDTIQFARYVPAVAARGARVVVEVQRPLQSLMASMPGAEQVVAAGDPLPHFDLHSPLLSLPLAFRTRLDSIPGATPYLTAPTDKVSTWRDRLGQGTKPRIGLVWAGNPRKDLPTLNRIDRQRSIAFETLAPLLNISGCSFYSLQKGDDAVEQLRNSLWRDRVIDLTDDLHDFSDTAALIENLDLVISVDTSVLHVAGALGKPVWLLNRHNTCWRWLREREDTPWYPTLRQFRQDATRDWNTVVTRVEAALKYTFAGGK
jgi:tetratricopeptide (TPR) repeat protein